MGWNDKSWAVISQSLPVKKPVEPIKEVVKVEVQEPDNKKSPQSEYFSEAGANPESGDMPR